MTTEQEKPPAPPGEKPKGGITITSVDEKSQAQGAQGQNPAAPQQQTSKISMSRGFANWLSTVRTSLAFTSYQTGQLFLVGLRRDKKVAFNQQNFTRAMGICGNADRIYIGSLYQIWRLDNMLQRNERANEHHDRVYIPRAAQTIGDLDIHEMSLDATGRMVFVNTKYSCLATLSQTHSFKPLWKPKFISKLAAEDRCHLNGLCMVDGIPRYVTAVSQSNVLNGWRERRHEGGVLIEIETDRIVTDKLSMPHSPRFYNGNVWALDSGRGFLIRIDPASGKAEDITFCPGFLRGLSFHRGYAVVTASLPRDGTFQGLQLQDNIKARDGEPNCGIYVINLRTGDIVEWIRLEGNIKELFDITVLPGVQCGMAIGLGSAEIQSMITFENDFGPIVAQRPGSVAQPPQMRETVSAAE